MLTQIRLNITRLIALYEEQKQRAEVLQTELSECKAEALRYKEQITDLNRQIDNLRLMNACSGNSDDNAKTKEVVNKLIKEIDKCIKLIND